jgi:hypothetical protein
VIIEGDLHFPTLSRARHGLFESRSGTLKIRKKLFRRCDIVAPHQMSNAREP